MAFWAAVGCIAYQVAKDVIIAVGNRMGESSNTEKILGVVNSIGEE